MKKLLKVTLLSALPLLTMSAHAADNISRSEAPKDAELYIISPANGSVVTSPVTVIFGLKGMGVSPAGIEKAKTGHHHLIIDGNLPALDKPMGKEVMHFGGGQTEKTIELTPGKHTLQLILGNHMHVPHNPAVISEKITITVE